MAGPFRHFPESLETPGTWSFSAELASGGLWIIISGKGEGIDAAVADALRDLSDGEIREGGNPTRWTVIDVTFAGQSVLEAANVVHANAEELLRTFTRFDCPETMKTAIRMFQNADATRTTAETIRQGLIRRLTAPGT